MPEISRSEIREPEASPQEVVGSAVAKIEARDGADRPEWRQKAVKYLGAGGKGVLTVIGVPLAIISKVVLGVLGFAKKLISSGGKMSFKEGFEMGGEMLSFEGKKEKK